VNGSLQDTPPGLHSFVARLQELALDLFWSWNHAADALWSLLDPELWSLTHNPWVVLQTVSRRRLAELAEDTSFRRQLDELLAERQRALSSPAWFQRTHPQGDAGVIAYFSLEFMLSEALPLYSGGLGNVAGDQMKAASDLGLPLVGVGLLYQQGYFRQLIDTDGRQHAFYPYNDPMQLPIRPLREHDGGWLRLEIELPGRRLWLRAWQVKVGRTRLFLLDSNDPANDPAQRGYTSELYGGGAELRIAQEIVLGIGGWRLLQRLGLEVSVCHLNEGHAAFTVLERARTHMRSHGVGFGEALAVTRAGNVFTTHTPVAAAFDRYEPALLTRHLGRYAREELGIDEQALLALGRARPDDPHEAFGMAFLALRGSGAVNGVSRLHGEVSRGIFQPLFARWPRDEVPIGHVTNGVHMPSWDSSAADHLWTGCCGRERWRESLDTVGQDIAQASDLQIWQMRCAARRDLVAYTRRRLLRQMAAEACIERDIDAARDALEPDVLTLGFARRFTAYKRPNLLLHDPDRLTRLLTDRQRPVQLIIAGKAHPDDHEGQEMVTAWIRYIRSQPEVRLRAVFLSDHDMLLSENLAQGVDVWINTPRRPWEACGTSGMKALVNGGLNLSALDGWWAEAYAPDLGWALGDGEPAGDAEDAECLYRLLETSVVPEFYARDADGLPHAWIERIRRSMSRLTPTFSANRSVREYTERYYLPAAAAYRARMAAGSGAALAAWQARIARHWSKLYFGRLDVATGDGLHRFALQAFLDELAPDDVAVQLYAEGPEGGVFPMTRDTQLAGTANGHLFRAEIPARMPATSYTPRIVPCHPGASAPLEAAHILWRDQAGPS